MLYILTELQGLHRVYLKDYDDGFANRQELNTIIRALQEIESYYYGESRTKEVSI